MHHFKKENGRLPKPWSNEDATQFKEMAEKINKEAKNPVESIDDSLIEVFAKTCMGDLSPMAAAIGGIVAEEVCKPTGSRYDGQVAVFGQDFQAKMLKQKYFV